MTEPALLIVELFREGEAVKKKIVRDGGPTLGKSAVLAAIVMLAEFQALQPGDLLTVRVPIEGEDVPYRGD